MGLLPVAVGVLLEAPSFSGVLTDGYLQSQALGLGKGKIIEISRK